MHNMLQLLLTFTLTMPAAAVEKRVLTMGVVDPDLVEPTQFILSRLVGSETDLSFKVVPYPRERLLVELNNGVIDGDASRYLEARSRLEQVYPNIRMLEESILTLDWVLISRAASASQKPLTFADVKDRQFAIPRGSLVGESLLSNVQRTATDQQAAEMLLAGRVDHIIGTRVFGHLFLPVDLPKGLVVQEQSIHRARLTLCFHKRHEMLMKRIAKMIRAANHNGSIRKWVSDLIALKTQTK